MPVLCSDLLDYSDNIGAESSETELRAAVSRAYYAGYHACVAWHESVPTQAGHNVGPGGGKHQVLINQLCNPDKSCAGPLSMISKGLGYGLREVREWRVEADYTLSATVNLERALNARARIALLLRKATIPKAVEITVTSPLKASAQG